MQLFLVGAGHVGLVTAVGLSRLGHSVTVADVDAARIDGLRAGRPPIFEPGLTEAIADAAARGRLTFTTDLTPPPAATFTFVCVNTPTGPEGPLSTHNVEAAVAALLEVVTPDHVVAVRSTLPLDGPDRLATLVAGRGDRPAIVTNPEFMREGQALEDFDRPNRVVVGWLEPRDREAAECLAALYAPLEAPSLVADARSVAIVKLLSNVFLATKIAFANEVARLADRIGADAATAIEGIGLDARIGTAFMKPGPGFGGSCLPEQAVAIALELAALDVEAPLLSAVHRANAVHQRSIVGRVATLVGDGDRLDGRRVAILGLAFKANTDDVRESPALALASALCDAGATVVGYDPRAAGRARRADPSLAVADTAIDAARDADAVVVATEWPEFGTLDWAAVRDVMRGHIVYDTRGIADVDAATRAGLRLEVLGRPGPRATPAAVGR